MFFLCHNLRLHKRKNRGIAYVKRSSFCFMCSISMPYFANQDPLPTLRPGNFDIHTKMLGIRPCLSRSIQMSSLCRFTSRRQAEWTPLQASCYTKIGDMPLFKVQGERNPQKFCISANSLSDLKDKGTCWKNCYSILKYTLLYCRLMQFWLDMILIYMSRKKGAEKAAETRREKRQHQDSQEIYRMEMTQRCAMFAS